jgi:hypothetical protein
MPFVAHRNSYRQSIERLQLQWPLCYLLILGLVLRLAWLWFQASHVLWLDEPEYLQVAESLRSGQYIDNQLWVRPPLFPAWLALTLGPTDSVLLAQLAQVALGTVLLYALYRVTLAAWGSQRTALLSVGLAAVYLPLIVYSSYLMADIPLLVVLCGLLLALLALARGPTARLAALAGATLAVAALIKPIALACLPALLVAIWVGDGTWRRRAELAALALTCCAAMIAPWTIRNAVVHQRFILLETTGGFNAWFGNRPPDGDLAFMEEPRRIYTNPADIDAAYAARARANVLAYPAHTLRQIGAKLIRFWRTDTDVIVTQQYGELLLACPENNPRPTNGILDPDDAEQFMSKARPCRQALLSIFSDLIYLPLLAGTIVTMLWLPRTRFTLIALVWFVPAYGVMALTVVQPRLRLAIVPVLLPYAAAGLMYGWDRLRERRTARVDQAQRQGKAYRLSWRTVVAVCATLVACWALNIAPLAGSQIWLSLGNAAWRAGDPAAALARYHAATNWYPTRASAQVAAGQAAEAIGDDDQALQFYTAATSIVAHNTQAHVGLARIWSRRGDLDRVTAEIRSTSLSPALVEALGFTSALLPARPRLDAGELPAAEYGYMIGLYPPEGLDGFRWTGSQIQLRFGTLPTPSSTVSLRLSNGRPTGMPAPWVEILMDGKLIDRIHVPEQWHVYRFVVPATPDGVRLTLRTETFVPAFAAQQTDNRLSQARKNQDVRPRGFYLDWATLTPLDKVSLQSDQSYSLGRYRGAQGPSVPPHVGVRERASPALEPPPKV